jgi:hypothetical protein
MKQKKYHGSAGSKKKRANKRRNKEAFQICHAYKIMERIT